MLSYCLEVICIFKEIMDQIIIRYNKLGLRCAKLKSSLASKASQPKGYVELYRLQEYALLLLENYYSGWGGVGVGGSEN